MFDAREEDGWRGGTGWCIMLNHTHHAHGESNNDDNDDDDSDSSGSNEMHFFLFLFFLFDLLTAVPWIYFQQKTKKEGSKNT